MRKFTVGFLTITMFILFANYSVGAVDKISASYKIEEVSGTKIKYQLLIRGNAEPDERVVVRISDGNEKIVAIDQILADSSGDFNLKTEVLSSGIYHIETNSETDNFMNISVEIKDYNYYNDIIKSLNEAENADKISEILLNNANDLGLDMTYYSGLAQVLVSEYMYSHKGEYTAANLTDMFETAIIQTYLKSQQLREFSDEIIRYYDEYLGICSQEKPASLYNDYLSLDENIRIDILNEAFSDMDHIGEAREKFNFSVAKNVIKSLNLEKMDEFILKHLDYFDFDDYTKLQTITKSRVLSELKELSLGKNIESIRKAYNNALDHFTNQTASNGGGGAGGSGGSVGRGGSVGGTGGQTIIYGNESLAKPEYYAEETTLFSDINDVEWARDAIMFLYRKGIVNGKGNKIFAPMDNITRGEFSKILSLSFGFYDENAIPNFNDITDNDWAYSYIGSMQSKGYILGYTDGGFHSDDYVSREDMAVILYRIMSINRYKVFEGNYVNRFDDYEEISDYARNAVTMLCGADLIRGTSESTFEPLRAATRAEVCTLLYRLLEDMPVWFYENV